MEQDKRLSCHGLLEALIQDPCCSPERGNATPDRIREILEVLLEDDKVRDGVYRKCLKSIGGEVDVHASLDYPAALRLAAVLVEELEEETLAAVSLMLDESELSTAEVVETHRRYKIPVSHLEDDLLPVRGYGAAVWDSRGREYVDLDANYSATNLGNANPQIARGLYNQASLLISQKEDRISVSRTRFLREVLPMMPGNLHHFYWQNSGGEAVDKSLKLAKAFNKHRGVIAFSGGFHGRTHGAVAVTHNEAYRKPFGLHREDWVHFVDWGDLKAVETLLKQDKAKSVILELVQGEEAGIRPAEPAFAHGLRELCDKHKAVMIVDEVQTGFARVAAGAGDWFASQRYDLVPDIITIGKSFGGGYPVTAVVTKPEIAQRMKPGYDGSTFGGNPMAMTAALIATRQMRELDLPLRVVERAAQFKKGLEAIRENYDVVGELRVVGLMIGIGLDSPERVADVQERMKPRGAHSSLSTGRALRWLPPLVITEEQVDVVLAAFDEALAASLEAD
ncbi:MAG: aminotransferase class III-fold pyridoxal phosphate-dependent enzyme [Candidatus Coatesbacteria bacterium]|nr:aminotransferase class III-fold pyridoxal phosphate-dependent enzyme [Candidatus Coatesbacteria bacterium]